MTRFFERGTVMAEMERQMTMAPNFTPRGHGSAVLSMRIKKEAPVSAGTGTGAS